MLDPHLTRWFITRAARFADVPPEKLRAETDAVERLAECNAHYEQFLKQAVFPDVERLVADLQQTGIVHRVSTWGNQLALRIHLDYRWGELIISQSQEDLLTFEHRIISEGESRGDDSVNDHKHDYDLREPLPAQAATTELHFFMSRMAQDLYEQDDEPELPPEK